MLARFVLIGSIVCLSAHHAALDARADAADEKKVEEKKTGERAVTFESVKPILAKRCAKCHNAERPRGELDLSTYGAIMLGGVSGKVVVSGKSDASLLYTLTA